MSAEQEDDRTEGPPECKFCGSTSHSGHLCPNIPERRRYREEDMQW